MKSAKRQKPEEEAKEIMKECKANYARTLNHLLFMHVVDRVGTGRGSLLPKDFALPESGDDKIVP